MAGKGVYVTDLVREQEQSGLRETFVGREQQLADLWERLEIALNGRGQVAFIVGQAGSGKTALVQHFLRRALSLDAEFGVAVGSCNAQTGAGDPYLPFREALLTLTGSTPDRRIAGVLRSGGAGLGRTALARSVQVLVEVAPDLVGLFVPGAALAGAVGKAVADKLGWMDKLDEVAKPGDKPAPDQARIFEQYTRYIQRLSEQVPVLLFIDDLQWADSASLGLFFHLARRIESYRVILVGAYRPSDVALGRGGERHPLEPIVRELTRYHGDISIDLDHIPDLMTRHFIDALVDAEPNRLDEAFRQALYEHTQGHALFTVELLDTMRHRGNLLKDATGVWVTQGEIDWGALPPRVEGVIGERIDRLDDELRELLTVASVEGESFTAEVVARVEALAEREVVRHLGRELAEDHRLVRPQGTVRIGPQRLSLYRFLHNLFQQYLYGSLSEAERAYLHRDIGEVLESLFAGQTEEVAAPLARHFEESAVWEKAAGYRLQAAGRALRMSAHREAVGHAERGLALLRYLPNEPQTQGLSLALHITLGISSVGVYGYAAPQVEAAFTEARGLARALGDPAQEVAALYGLCGVTFVHAELGRTRDLGEQMVTLARDIGAEGFVLGGQVILGSSGLYLGELEQARASLEKVVSSYDPVQHRHLGHLLSQDPRVAAQAFLSWILWQQGYPDQAVTAIESALAWAREIDHPYSLGYALSFAATLQQMLRKPRACLTYANQALDLGRRSGFPTWEAMGHMAWGWAQVMLGDSDAGIPAIVRGLEMWHATGARLGKQYFRTMLAEAYGVAGDWERGLQTLEEADWSPEAIWWIPDQHRVRAQLLLKQGGAEREAEALLRDGLTVARSHADRASELRLTTLLAKLIHAQGRSAEGRETLGQVYAWFQEGFDTPDLRDAKALLDEPG